MTYLLPDIRTPGDKAHLPSQRNGALCGWQRSGVTLVRYDFLCAFRLCEDCQRIDERGNVAEWTQRGLFEGLL